MDRSDGRGMGAAALRVTREAAAAAAASVLFTSATVTLDSSGIHESEVL